MSEKKKDYWRRRAIQFEKDWFNHSRKTIEKKLADHYQKSLSAIQDDILKLYGSFAKDNGLDFDEAKKLLNSQEYRRWRMSMQEYLQQIADGEKSLERELNTLAMRPRINRLEKLYSETLQELDKLGRNVDADIKNFLADGYRGTYAKDIFDLVKIGGLSVAIIAKVENIHIEKVLASRWSGKTFSQRIWTNTKLLNGVLRETISSGVHRGLSIPQISKMVEDKMNAGYKNSVRLVRTEMNFFNNQAHADSMADAGVAAYEFIAVMDNRTSAACRSRDGETYPLEEKTVGFNYPPLHPRCRSTVCPFIEGVSRKGTRTAKVGGKNIDIPENMKYADYEKVYIKKEISFEDWQKNNLNNIATNGKMSVVAKSQWAERDKLKILSKEEYKKLRELAESSKIYLSGVKTFDGKFETVKEAIETLASLQAKFPKVVSGGKRLTLTLNENLDAEDFAVTTKIRNVNLNANAYRDLEKLKIEYQKAVDEGWFVKGTDYRAIIHHEFGHIVANAYKIDSLKIACEITGMSPKRAIQFVQENISEYAGSFPNGKEIISEVFADMTTSNPHDFSKKFYSKIVELAGGV